MTALFEAHVERPRPTIALSSPIFAPAAPAMGAPLRTAAQATDALLDAIADWLEAGRPDATSTGTLLPAELALVAMTAAELELVLSAPETKAAYRTPSEAGKKLRKKMDVLRAALGTLGGIEAGGRIRAIGALVRTISGFGFEAFPRISVWQNAIAWVESGRGGERRKAELIHTAIAP